MLFVTSFTCKVNPGLTSITNPITSTVITNYDVNSNNLSILDVSGMDRLSGVFNCSANPSLTTLTLPTSSQTFSKFIANDCNLNYFDFTTLSNLTESAGVSIDLVNNNLTKAEVNHFLVDLDTISTNAYTGRSIAIAGTNSAPDGSSGGYDGLTAKSNLISKGFTVTTN